MISIVTGTAVGIYLGVAAIILFFSVIIIVTDDDHRDPVVRNAYLLLRGGFLAWPLWLAGLLSQRLRKIREGMDS
ncbi:hypothetical protein [Nesterenkonia suensis]